MVHLLRYVTTLRFSTGKSDRVEFIPFLHIPNTYRADDALGINLEREALFNKSDELVEEIQLLHSHL